MRTGAASRAGALPIGLLAGLDCTAASAVGPDLEQRLEELERTAARSGSRNVSLRIYGQVNYALLSWDDGTNADTYVVDNDTLSSRLGFIGQGKIGDKTIAGCRVEMEFRGSSSMEVDAENDNFGGDPAIRLRQANWTCSSRTIGSGA